MDGTNCVLMEGKPKSVDPNRLTVNRLAKLLTNSYRQQVPAKLIDASFSDGAPINSG